MYPHFICYASFVSSYEPVFDWLEAKWHVENMLRQGLMAHNNENAEEKEKLANQLLKLNEQLNQSVLS